MAGSLDSLGSFIPTLTYVINATATVAGKMACDSSDTWKAAKFTDARSGGSRGLTLPMSLHA
jgi:hypothetical protein